MGKPGKNAPNNLQEQLGLQMKGSPYSMTAGQEKTFGPSGSNPNPGVYNGIKAADSKESSPAPFIGALIGGLGAKVIGGALAKTATKTLAGKAISAVGGAVGNAAKTAVSGIGEGISGIAEGLNEKVGGGGKGAFGDKVKNYIGSLDLITNSNPDGSLRKPSDEKDESAATTISGPGDVITGDVSSTVPMPSFNSSFDESAIPKQQANKRGIIDGKDYSKDLGGPEMGGPLNKIKNMCRG